MLRFKHWLIGILILFVLGCNDTPDEINFNELQTIDDNFYTLDDKPFSGSCGSFYEDGVLKSKLFFNKGYLDGNCFFYYKNGNLKAEKFFDKGKLSGSIVYYFDHGQVEEVGQMKNGKKSGVWKIYNESGILISRTNYMTNDSSKIEIFYPNGNLSTTGFFINELRQGEWLFYDSITGEKKGYIIFNQDIPVEISR